MARLVERATRVPVPGGKVIDEYVGRVNTADGAEYVAVCLPAFGPDLAHRDEG